MRRVPAADRMDLVRSTAAMLHSIWILLLKELTVMRFAWHAEL